MFSGVKPVNELERRYARAFFDYTVEQDKVESVRNDLETLDRIISLSPDIRSFLRSGALSSQLQEQMVTVLVDHFHISELVRRFLLVLVTNRRLAVLPGVILFWRRLYLAFDGKQEIHVVSASPLTREQKETIYNRLRNVADKDIILETHVDPEILGGLILFLGSKMIDDSLRNKLQRLRYVMKGSK